MASNPFAVSQAELLRVAAAAYHGKPYRVSLAYDPTGSLTLESTTAEYDALKLSGGSYVDITGIIGVGGYDPTDERIEVGTGTGFDTWINVTFGAFTAPKTYNIVYIVVDNHTQIYGRFIESPAVTVAEGFTSTSYPFQFVVDNVY